MVYISEKFILVALNRLRGLKTEYMKLGMKTDGGFRCKKGGSWGWAGLKYIIYEILQH